MLWECFSWASRNGVAQMSYLTWIRIRFTFWLICGSMFFIMLRWVEVSKMTNVFSVKLWTLLLIFVGFETEPENLKIKDKLQIRYFESFIFWSKFGIFGTVIELFFCECTFKFFAVGQQLSLTFLFNFRTIKKLPTALTLIKLSLLILTSKLPLWYYCTDFRKSISSITRTQSSEIEFFSNNSFANLILLTFLDVCFFNKFKEGRGNCCNNSLICLVWRISNWKWKFYNHTFYFCKQT